MRSWAAVAQQGGAGAAAGAGARAARGTPASSASSPAVSRAAASSSSASASGARGPPSGDAAALRLLHAALAQGVLRRALAAVQRDGVWPAAAPCDGSDAPVGLVNRGNTCFVNAAFQLLCAAPPTAALLADVASVRHLLPSDAAATNALADAVVQVVERRAPQGDGGPVALFALDRLASALGVAGEQQDAQEFLAFLLSCVHEELRPVSVDAPTPAVSGGAAGQARASGDGDGGDGDAGAWVEVGRAGRKAQTLVDHAAGARSMVDEAVGGVMRVVIARGSGSAPSAPGAPNTANTATNTPFTFLPVDIASGAQLAQLASMGALGAAQNHSIALQSSREPVVELRTALARSLHSELVEGAGRREVELLRAPNCLLLHLKRFVYSPGVGVAKLSTPVSFTEQLQLPASVMRKASRVSYELCAVVHHVGESATRGHYIAEVRDARGAWWRCDDERVEPLRGSPCAKSRWTTAYVLAYVARFEIGS